MFQMFSDEKYWGANVLNTTTRYMTVLERGWKLACPPRFCVDITAFCIEDERQNSGVVGAGKGFHTVYYAIKHMAKRSQAAAISKHTMADGYEKKLAQRVVVAVSLPWLLSGTC